MRVYGIVLAAGVGTRFGSDLPKQFMHVAGRTILEHSVAAFDASELIDETLVMMAPGWSAQAADALGACRQSLRILDGGTTRSDSTELALEAIDDEECLVVIHDAARPLVEPRIINECVRALDRYAAVGVVIPSADTIVEVNAGGDMGAIPNRDALRRMQTPQAFRVSVLRDAYRRARRDPDFMATDDCGVVLTYCPEVAVGTVPGSEQNLKVTGPQDIAVAEALLQRSTDSPAGGFEAELR